MKYINRLGINREYWMLKNIRFEVPQFNDLYIDKIGKIQRCKMHNKSKNAQKRVILEETWK